MRHIHVPKMLCQARNFLSELGFTQQAPTVLFEDNQSTIHLINNKGNNGRTKHIGLRLNFIREQTEAGTIFPQYLSTDLMTSDMLTKDLSPLPYLKLRPFLLGMYVCL